MTSPNYVFNEEKYLKEIKDGIDSTYDAHYAQNKVQSTEFIADAGHGEGFCIGNIIKYAYRDVLTRHKWTLEKAFDTQERWLRPGSDRDRKSVV